MSNPTHREDGDMDEFSKRHREKQMADMQARFDAYESEYPPETRNEFWFKQFDMGEACIVAAEVGFTDIEFGRSLWAWRDLVGCLAVPTVPTHRDAAFLHHLGYFIESSMWEDIEHNAVETERVMRFYGSFYPVSCEQFEFDMRHGVEYSRGVLLYPELQNFLTDELPRIEAALNRKRRAKALKRMRAKQPNNRTLRTA